MGIHRNIIGHCYRQNGANDKIYMCCIRNAGSSNTGDNWMLLGKWGRRGKKLSVQVKGHFSTEDAALAALSKLWRSQLNDGYMDISSSEYVEYMKLNGPTAIVRRDDYDAYLEDDSNDSNDDSSDRNGIDADDKNDFDKPEPIVDEGDKVLICVDNTGMEDHFDIGIEYLVEDHKDKSMVYVYDKIGQKGEYFRARFMTPDEWNKKPGKPGKPGKMFVNVIKNRDPKPVYWTNEVEEEEA